MKPIYPLLAAVMLLIAPMKAQTTFTVTVPTGTKACYVVGNPDWNTFNEMTKVTDTQYTLTTDKVDGTAYKYCSGPSWTYVEKDAAGEERGNRSYSALDEVATWAQVYEPVAPGTPVTYYIKNCWNGGDWTWQKMTPNADSTEWSYKDTYGGTGVNIANNEKGTDAAWYPQNDIAGNPTSGNEYTFVYNVAAGTVTAKTDGPGPQPSTTEYYLVGYINGADHGCGEDWATLDPNYKFVNGSLIVTFTDTSYVFVKANDNATWFMTNAYVEPATSGMAVLKNTNSAQVNEKIGVPSGVALSFTLQVDDANTLTLSYSAATKVQETVAQAKEVKKVMVDGQLRIQQGDKVVDVLGRAQ